MWYIIRTPPWYVDRDVSIRNSLRSNYTIRVPVVRTPVSSLSFQVQHTGKSGRVDMLTSPVPAARAAVATGAWVESKHDMYLIHTWK